MTKYLYGAAVQGIQSYIFRTNKLQDIVVASETVQKICTEAFKEFAHGGESIVRAAGNIKYVFDNKSDCEKAVLRFPKKIMQMAPGITISQAVTELKDEEDFGNAIDRIEKLLKEQRNKLPKSVTAGLMGIKRANNTGLPMEVGDSGSFGADTSKLCTDSFGQGWENDGKKTDEVSKLTGKNDWIAVIHADGNGIGQIVQKVGKDKDLFKEFSQNLDKATKLAANNAYTIVSKEFARKDCYIPMRPVVLSGDDMTIIIRGDLAMLYAKTFIVEFEKSTKRELGKILENGGKPVFADGKDYLTACAGIAFIKSSYPFFYGYELAEDLCTQAKKDTKSKNDQDCLPKSCLMFHKVQDSFISSYSDIEKRELTAVDKLSFKAGPYYTKEDDKGNIELLSRIKGLELEECREMLDSENGDGIKSGIRNWISLRLTDAAKAKQRLDRMKNVFTDNDAIRTLTSEVPVTEKDKDGKDKEVKVCIAYDALAYHTIMNQETNS